MAAAKNDLSTPVAAGRWQWLLAGPGRPLAWLALLAGLLVAAWYGVWYGLGVGPRLLQSPAYVLSVENVEITPPPKWIHTDPRAEVFRDLCLDGPPSILDDRLAQRARDAFALHPWVAKVIRVTKHHPARLSVELEYRRPVCMVEVPGGLYPVDVEGVWLPVDFSPVEASQYPRLSGILTQPVGSIGTRWGDVRVVGGAEIAAALEGAWNALQLQRIVPVVPAGSPGAEFCTYELYTRGGTRIIWGRAPGTAAAGELPALEKVARLRRYAEEHGTLEGQTGPQQIDLRDPQMLRISPRAA